MLILAAIIYAIAGEKTGPAQLDVTAAKGRFEVLVTVTGELQAENSRMIEGPIELRSSNIRIQSVRIQDLIPEGTVVSAGEWVATLDRSEADNTLKDMEDMVQREEASYIKTQLDTTITLSNLRDEMINLNYQVEERKLTLEQSAFEPPATIRQAEINLERAERGLEQAIQNYELRRQQSMENMTEAAISLDRQRRRYNALYDVLNKFIITAPTDGMVIYHREWSGQKRAVGSNINPRDLTVATLPDLTSMISRTYVNEIDISKVRVGQRVRIGVDAFPEKRYSGQVIQVANVGQQLPNTDAKVFEVLIKVNESDEILRPAMTTSNVIVTNSFDDVIYIPLEAVHITDSIPFVYKSNNTTQIVLLGEANDNFIIVEEGLSENERIYLTIPENASNFKQSGTELIAVINERQEKRRQEEQARQSNQTPVRRTGGGMRQSMMQGMGQEGENTERPEIPAEAMERIRQMRASGDSLTIERPQIQ